MLTLLVESRNELGEGPLWDAAHQRLYWVDIAAGLLWAWDQQDGRVSRWSAPRFPSALALQSDGTLLVATQAGFFEFSPGAQTFELASELPLPDSCLRPNDGAVDPQGRFWVGTMDDSQQRFIGQLLRRDPDGRCSVQAQQLGIPNTLVWSPDGGRFYHADSALRRIDVYDFDPQSGRISGKRPFATPSTAEATPDGSAMDAQGFLWNAEWGSGRIVRYSPEGVVERIVTLPVSNTTSCVFGGEGLQTLFVTSARQGLDSAQLSCQPLAGSVFAVDVPVAGLERPRCLKASGATLRNRGPDTACAI